MRISRMHAEVQPLESVGLSDPTPVAKAFFAHLVNSPKTSPSLKEKGSKKYMFGEGKSSKDKAYARVLVGPAQEMRQKILAASLFPSVY